MAAEQSKQNNIRARHFRCPGVGETSHVYAGTEWVAHSTGIDDLHEELHNVRTGDLVYVFDWWLMYVGEGKWRNIHPEDPMLKGLYAKAVLAERETANA